MNTNEKTIIPGILLVLLALMSPVWGQETVLTETQAADTDSETTSSIDTTVAVWGNKVVDDSSKAEEYGEVPEGFLINSFHVDVNMPSDRFLEFSGKNVGLNHALYDFDYGLRGKYELMFNYTKIPHLFSKSGETIWTEVSPGVWRIPDSVQQTIQNLNPFDPILDPVNYSPALARQRGFVKDLLLNATATPLGLQRNRSTAGFAYTPNMNWKYGVEYFRENRDGNRPFGTSLGFSWATELPEPIDYSTDRVRTGVEYAKQGKAFSIFYDLSLFKNDVNTITWDNPLRITDRTFANAYTNGDGTSQARVQLPVDNTSHMISFSGASKLGRGRVTGNFSWNTWTDDVTLLPFTINSAINNDPAQASLLELPSSTFNGDIRNINANLRYYVPVGNGSLTASYRLFDESNHSDQFEIGHYVRFDQVIEERVLTHCDPATNTCEEQLPLTHLFAYKTNTVDLDYQTAFADKYHWFGGYSFTKRDLEEREVSSTDSHSLRTGLNIAAADWLNLTVSYVYLQRRLNDFVIENRIYLPIFTPLTRYDIADVNRNQLRVLADMSLGTKTTLGVAASYWKNDYQDVAFGLQAATNWSGGVDLSYMLNDRSSVNLFYEHTQNNTDQTGRQSTEGATGIVIQGDWSVGVDDDYDTVGVGYLWSAKDQKWNWDTNISYARADGVAEIFGATLIRPRGAVGFEDLDDTELLNFKTGVTCKTFKRARFAIYYYYDNYQIEDFAEDSTATDIIGPVITPTGQTFPGTITLNGIQPNYSYHTGWIGLIYSW